MLQFCAQSIKGREDVLERLKVASDKLDASVGGGAPLALSPTDPLVRLFYRCVHFAAVKAQVLLCWHNTGCLWWPLQGTLDTTLVLRCNQDCLAPGFSSSHRLVVQLPHSAPIVYLLRKASKDN